MSRTKLGAVLDVLEVVGTTPDGQPVYEPHTKPEEVRDAVEQDYHAVVDDDELLMMGGYEECMARLRDMPESARVVLVVRVEFVNTVDYEELAR